ncbi:NAD(P)/FAD-dependent oxidoreductase [Yimella sp. cx-51]|uniref:NAD(P)/FAD-dependent oxidoreductase n=1 Tax=Yimella sp. cx-51 TaxID=2770551 RepID=UPI00165E92AC|nr:NAD(P)/FAD-dependent oxidoreductase [Yimella sp. cx-51]MBC9955925.1 NAD(P)/FAD-dependent oxidoreductase [Yimella sp. cx-51]QTH37533.1 NAD(P)/FAD-dependent oxidoreductase [Yimella sp. cx-51]
MTEQTSGKPRVVVLGGGFGGLATVRALRKTDVDVVLIDRHNYNTFQPLLYQVATATLNPGDVTWFLRAVREHNPRVRFVNGEVSTIDHEQREVLLEGGEAVRYDYLVIATGVTANFFGVPGADKYALPLYTRAQALAVRDRLFAGLEYAAAHRQGEDVRIVVVGGGATGVETAGALAELRNNDMPVTYPELSRERTHVTLIEMAPQLLSAFGEKSQEYARKALLKRDVDLRLNTTVKEVRENGVVVGDDEFLPAGVVVWASGIKAPDAVANWGVPQGRGGRIKVDDHLRVEGLDKVFAVGDIAVEEGDRALPQLAQPALQGGDYVARQIKADLHGEQVEPFKYKDKGILATIGRSSAVAEATHLPRMQGFPAWVIWTGVHVFTLLGVRNRAAAMVNLGSRYLFWHRSHNAIVGDTPTAHTLRPGTDAAKLDEVAEAHSSEPA